MSDENDRTLPVKAANNVPVISADQYSHVGKYAGAVVMSVFHQIGGVERMASWADQNPSSFYEKIFPKMIQRSTAVEHSGNITIDDAISRLERMDTVIDADFEEVKTYDL